MQALQESICVPQLKPFQNPYLKTSRRKWLSPQHHRLIRKRRRKNLRKLRQSINWFSKIKNNLRKKWANLIKGGKNNKKSGLRKKTLKGSKLFKISSQSIKSLMKQLKLPFSLAVRKQRKNLQIYNQSWPMMKKWNIATSRSIWCLKIRKN